MRRGSSLTGRILSVVCASQELTHWTALFVYCRRDGSLDEDCESRSGSRLPDGLSVFVRLRRSSRGRVLKEVCPSDADEAQEK